MSTYLPGTMIEAKPENCETVLSAIFSAGGLVLSQVCTLTGLEQHTIQNWVKRGYLTHPVHKKYSYRQFCRIAIISMLKDSIQLDEIVKLLSYINGSLHEDSSMMDDTVLYNCFTALVCLGDGNLSAMIKHIEQVTKNFAEPFYGMRKRLENVLHIMATAYVSAQLKKQVALSIASLDSTR